MINYTLDKSKQVDIIPAGLPGQASLNQFQLIG